MHKRKVAVIVGSLRKGSFNLKMAKQLISLAPESLSLEILPIADLPLCNEDLEESLPETWKQFRAQLRQADGVLFVTPEYNRSMSGALKNALDVGSRPYGQSAWDGKPGAVMSVSISAIGGFGANHHLRQSLVFINVPCMQQPEAYIGNAGEIFDDKGGIKVESTREYVQNFLRAYADWVEAHVGVVAS